MLSIYTLDGTISEFFATQSSVTREQCDKVASSLVGNPVIPTPIQGCFSYTVTGEAVQSKIIQFRAHTSLLDMSILALARDLHPQFVPSIDFHSTLGEGEALPLSVYVMDKVPGDTSIVASFSDESTVEGRHKAESCRLSTIRDLATFVHHQP